MNALWDELQGGDTTQGCRKAVHVNVAMAACRAQPSSIAGSLLQHCFSFSDTGHTST